MSNFSDFIGGGGGGALPVNIVLGHSQTWVPPVDGNICIHVVGAGGSGRGRIPSYSGGAGGYCKKNSLAVTTSGSFTVVVGAGGQGTSGSVAGNNGGNTTVSGTGLSATLTANGGGGAPYPANSNGAGGTAANGDVNNTGGAGGSKGGGAVGITGTGNAGGSQNYDQNGGDCDVVGPESLMGYGYICGGIGGKAWVNGTGTVYTNYASYGVITYPPDGNGGFLAGGGQYECQANGVQAHAYGGKGGIGGGGGGCFNNSGGQHLYSSSGDGGNGIVIIQYLPA
tara:strand:- start:972 stop:1817 length:846 start_codon:yes stop_codon:yes gene_type:complete